MKEKYIMNWLREIIEVWSQPKTVRYCGIPEMKGEIKKWSESWFGCEFIKSDEINIINPGLKLTPQTPMTIISPRSPRSEESEEESPRNKTPTLIRKKSSPRAFAKWINEITTGTTHAIIFSEGDIGMDIYKHINGEKMLISTKNTLN